MEAPFTIPDELGIDAYAGMLAIETATDVEEHSKSLGRELTANDFEPVEEVYLGRMPFVSNESSIRPPGESLLFLRILYTVANLQSALVRLIQEYQTGANMLVLWVTSLGSPSYSTSLARQQYLFPCGGTQRIYRSVVSSSQRWVAMAYYFNSQHNWNGLNHGKIDVQNLGPEFIVCC